MNTGKSLALMIALAFAPASMAEDIAMKAENFDLNGKTEFAEHVGKQAVKIENGAIQLKLPPFEDGIIKFSLNVPKERGFSGIRFRGRTTDGNLQSEVLYFRHHMSGMPDATQYQPTFNGNGAWQLLHDPRYAWPQVLTHGEWMDVKLVVAGDMADVYINSADDPVFTIGELKTGKASGTIQLYSGFAPAWFADVSVEPLGDATIKGSPAPLPETPDTRVKTWEISSNFDSKLLEGAYELADAGLPDLTWQSLEAEEAGIANISRIARRGNGGNTVFAKLNLKSDGPSNRMIRFGYSDDVVIYVNGKRTYSGSNAYLNRDYRYLGTIGLFDELALPLKDGDNEILFAVTEFFGGWGIMADLPVTEAH